MDDKVVEYIEQLRPQQKNNDVVFYVISRVNYLKHSINFVTLTTKAIEENNNMTSDILTKYDNNDINLKILINADKDENRLLFHVVDDDFRVQLRISILKKYCS